MEGNSDKPNNRSILYAIIAACVLCIIIVGALVVLKTENPEGFSELYFENPEDLPTVVEAGEPVDFAFVVVSHEDKLTTYKYNVTYDKNLINSGNFTLMPPPKNLAALEGINKKTIRIRLVPNETSLVRIDRPFETVSRTTQNIDTGTIVSYSAGPGKVNIITSPKGYSVIVWGENNITQKIDVDLPGTSDKIIFPGISRGSSQDFLIFDTAKQGRFRTNISNISQVGILCNPELLDNGTVSNYGYKVQHEIWDISNNYGYLDMLKKTIEENYRYEFKKVSVNVASEKSVIIQADEKRTADVSSGELAPPSEYEIHFWIIVMGNYDTERLLASVEPS